MMTLDPSASGGGIAGVTGSLFGSPQGQRGTPNCSGIVNADNNRGGDTIARHSSSSSSYYHSRALMGGSDGKAGGGTEFTIDNTALLHRGGGSGGLVWRSALANNTTISDHDHHRISSGNSRGAAAAAEAGAAATRLTEAWSLLEASEAARRRLSEEVKGWADRTASLESALAAAEATAESRAREARLLAASLQDATDGLALEEAARREAEGRADALR